MSSNDLLSCQVGEGQLCHRLSMLMALCIYCGNATKDLVSAPRPFQVRSCTCFAAAGISSKHLAGAWRSAGVIQVVQASPGGAQPP